MENSRSTWVFRKKAEKRRKGKEREKMCLKFTPGAPYQPAHSCLLEMSHFLSFPLAGIFTHASVNNVCDSR